MFSTNQLDQLDVAKRMMARCMQVPPGDHFLSEDDIDYADNVTAEEMVAYFEATLSEPCAKRLEVLASCMHDFRESMLIIGEIVIGRLEDQQEARSLWRTLRNHSFDTPADGDRSLARPTLEFELSNSLMMAADSHSLHADACTNDEITFEIFEDGENIIFDATSDVAEWDGKLIGIRINSQTKSASAYVMLRLGASGVVSGYLEMPRSDLVGKVKLYHAIVGAEDLDSTDVTDVLRSLQSDIKDVQAKKAWTKWVNEIRSSRPVSVRALLTQVESILERIEE